MKKALSLWLALAMTLGLALTACGGGSGSTADAGATDDGGAAEVSTDAGDEGEEAPAETPDGATPLTLWTFQAQHEVFYREAAKRWNDENPDKAIDLEILVLADEDLNNNLQISFQSGTGAPDIVDIEINKYPNYLQGDVQLVELNDYIDPYRDDIVDARLNVYSKDGKNYGICFHVGATVIYYNTEIMDEAGVDIDAINTWADYRAAAEQVKENTGLPMTTVEIADSWTTWPMMNQAGSDFFDADGNCIIDNDTNIMVMEYLQDLLQNDLAVTTPGGQHHMEEYYASMNAGSYGSIWMPLWYMGRFTDYMSDLSGKIAIRPMPAWEEGGNRSATMGGTGTSVTTQSENVELAAEFLAYAKLSYDMNIVIWEMLGFDPINKAVWDDPAMKASNQFTDFFGDNIFDVLLEVQDEFNDVHIVEDLPTLETIYETDGLLRLFVDYEDPATVLGDIADQIRG